jgi:hypothetical protein
MRSDTEANGMTTNNNPPQPVDLAGVPERIWLPADTDHDTWNILAKNPSRNWKTGEPANNIEFVRATQPATTPSDDGWCDCVCHPSAKAVDYKYSRCVHCATTPPDVTERARRAVSTLRAANILLADPTEAELIEATAIIAAEFGEGEK